MSCSHVLVITFVADSSGPSELEGQRGRPPLPQILARIEAKPFPLKFMFSKKATKIDEIFTVDLTICSNCQIDGEDFVSFGSFLRKYEL